MAGDKNLREQHFRIKDADAFQDCHMVTEGKTSVDSKIVLKCWLDDNLHAEDLESRVPISAVSNSARKYEFSFMSPHYTCSRFSEWRIRWPISGRIDESSNQARISPTTRMIRRR